ncbi:MAG TPA: helix-turn-helix domain-containing protein [Chitinophagaceae bacterium]|jgi:AraC-like DNA-binding protein|nr:helix-turn-helix domain-containing protein [Chitinophagaceae bacterium]
MNYQVFTPSPELQPFVKCFWTLEDEGKDTLIKQRVIPDGCMEMIFHCGDRYRQYFEDGTSLLQPRCFIFGQISNYIDIAPTGVSNIVAARFLPEGLAPFLKIPVTHLENKAVDLESLFGSAGKELEEKVIAAVKTGERIGLIEIFLLSLLTEPAAIDMITRNCVDIILRSQGQLDITELAGKANVNRRNMERKFVSMIGMSPKQLSRVVRLQATIKMLGQQKFTSLTSLAYENGYYDQAHFIRDFKEFAGTSPKSFFAGNLQLAALFASAE